MDCPSVCSRDDAVRDVESIAGDRTRIIEMSSRDRTRALNSLTNVASPEIATDRQVAGTYRKGYSQLSSLIGDIPEFQNFRRFRRTRARLMLRKQDLVVQLENKLDHIDNAEQSELFLGSMRKDENEERKHILQELDEALKDYGTNA